MLKFSGVHFTPEYTRAIENMSCMGLEVRGGNLPREALLGLVPVLNTVENLELTDCCDLSDAGTLDILSNILEHSARLKSFKVHSQRGSPDDLERLSQAYLNRVYRKGKESLRDVEISSDAAAPRQYFKEALDKLARDKRAAALPGSLPTEVTGMIIDMGLKLKM